MARRYSSRKHAQVLHRRAVGQEQKVNPLYEGMTIIDGMTQPRTMPKNYKNYAREGYAGNDTVWKVVNFGITNGAAIQPILYKSKDNLTKTNRIDKHPLLDRLARPNPEQSGVFFRKAILGYFLVSGNSFQYAIRAAKSGPPDELWTLSPELVQPIPDGKRGIVGYEYTAWPKEKNPIPKPLIGHMRSWNPNDEFFGMSPIEVIAVLIDTQKDGRTWNLSLLQNFLKPPGAWTTTAMLAPNDRAKLEARINEKMAGARNAGKTPVLDGALEFKPSAVNPSEMDWLESMKYNAGSIANVWNMPPELIGDTSASTFNNKEMAEIFAYTEYIFPTLDDLYDLWNMWLVPMYPDLCDAKGNPTAYLYYDKESVEVIQKMIQAQKDAQADRANKLWMSGLAMQSEAQELAGLQVNPQGDVYRFGAVLVAKDEVGKYAEQSLTKPAAPPIPAPEPIQLTPGDPSNPPGTDDTQDPANNKPGKKPVNPKDNADDATDDSDSGDDELDNQPARKPTNKPKSSAFRSTKALDLSTAKDKDAYRKQMEEARERWTDEATERIAAYFAKERRAVVKALKSHDSTSGTTTLLRGTLADLKGKLSDTIVKLWQDVGDDIGNEVAQAFDADEKARRQPWEHKAIPTVSMVSEATVKRLLAIAGEKVKTIDATTLKLLKVALADGVAEGESIPQIAKRIDALYLDEIIPNRSTTIARTEILGASNWSSHEVATNFSQQYGIQLTKQWLATGDNRTRPTHVDADGQEVGLDEYFEVGGSELLYPGDPSGPADEVIDCRCTQIYNRVTANGTEENLGSDDSDVDEEKRARRTAYRNYVREGVLV